MEHKLADVGLQLTCLQGPYQLEEARQEAILDDLTDDCGDASDQYLDFTHLFHHDLNDCDFLILANDLKTGKLKAVLGLLLSEITLGASSFGIPFPGVPDPAALNLHPAEAAAEKTPFLEIKTAYVAPAWRGRSIMKRMVAFALLRIACVGPVPKVVVARTSSPVWFRNLRHLSNRFAGAVFFPDHDSPTIRMDSVRMAQCIARQIAPSLRFKSGSGTLCGGNMTEGAAPARPVCSDPRIQALFGLHLEFADQMLVTIDMRAQSESAILDSARRLYRTRRPVFATVPSVGPDASRYPLAPIRQFR